MALDEINGDQNLANQLMLGIKDYPFMHSGLALVTGVIKAFRLEIPCLGEFLQSRLIMSPHQDAGSLKRKALKDPHNISDKLSKYCTMIADPWHCKNALSDILFDPTKFEKTISLVYFDIPQLH